MGTKEEYDSKPKKDKKKFSSIGPVTSNKKENTRTYSEDFNTKYITTDRGSAEDKKMTAAERVVRKANADSHKNVGEASDRLTRMGEKTRAAKEIFSDREKVKVQKAQALLFPFDKSEAKKGESDSKPEKSKDAKFLKMTTTTKKGS